jgi:endonuclease/exonuclease/phosphatase (EEP) superfamily protein YafD
MGCVTCKVTKCVSKNSTINTVYAPPSNSSYSKELDHEILGHIEKEIEHFQKRGNVLLCGDFNTRVGSENDFKASEISIISFCLWSANEITVVGPNF